MTELTRNESLEPMWEQLRADGCINGRQVLIHKCLDSTNTTALNLAAAGIPAGTVVAADSQSAGRGRLGRKWQSPPGLGLYFSIITRPRLSLNDLTKITLTAGLALRTAILAVSALETELKWPNDILWQGRKMAGILTECEAQSAKGRATIIGIGLNINSEPDNFPSETGRRMVSLRTATNRSYDRGLILTAVTEAVEREVKRLENGDFAAILRDWRRWDASSGKQLTWLKPDGMPVCGMSLGPDEDGVLRIKDSTGLIHQVISGDLRLQDEGKKY
ncbi:biotin--[acetyl-CoA-carboxylase] ligase [Desulfobacterota bacterium M19]